MRAYAQSACARAGLRSELELEEPSAELPRETAIALFRVVEEGLTNTIRHAGARSVRLCFADRPDACRLLLHDDGCGFDIRPTDLHPRPGLLAIRERVRALGGSLEIESSPETGTTLRVSVPRPRG